MKKIIYSVFVMMLTLVSCVDKDFDEPPIGGLDPAGVTANTTIAQVKIFFAGGGTVTALPDSMIFAGIVVSSDETGNIYKSIVLQDSTGGILIRIDRSSSYVLMPVGRRIFVKCSGLYISDYGGLIQLGVKGNGGVNRIPDLLIDQHLIRGQWSQPYGLKVTQDISSLNDIADQNKLVRLDNVHFDASAVCQVWSDVAASTNRNLLDNSGNIIVVRSSNFATFAAELIPGGVGSVEGIFQIFGTTKQFVIRDLNDVFNFPPNTCAALHTPIHSIAEAQALFALGGSNIAAGSYIDGVVISDKDSGNITANNIVLQAVTGGAGITVRFSTPNTFGLGTKLHIDISNQTLYSYNGLLEVTGVTTSVGVVNTLATVTGTGTITPRVTTIADLLTNGEAWESTLVQLSGITISGGGTYSGTTTLSDGTGNTVALYTRSGAFFATSAYPTGPVTITAMVSDFNARQLNIRTTADVQP